MDPYLADEVVRQVAGKQLHEWTLTPNKLGEGKSAVVVEATSPNGSVAVKLFDRTMVSRLGFDAQMERIHRECLLVGKEHPNLVKILGGGYWKDLDLLYVVMEFVPLPSLDKVYTEIPKTLIRPLVAQIAEACEFLEAMGLVHRDIKIDNICVAEDFRYAKLMDLGVLRPHVGSDITDENGIANPPVTRRYCPPEYLSRTEDPTVDGWRAITFYQLGGLLHDLIMGYRLFTGVDEPDDKLAESIKCYKPPVSSADVDDDLCLLARACLAKPVETRLRLVRWQRFKPTNQQQSGAQQAKLKLLERLAVGEVIAADQQRDDVPDTRESARTAAEQLRERVLTELTAGNALPTLETRSSPGSDETEWQLAFIFHPSRRFEKPTHVHFVLWLRVEDAGTQHITVHLAASPEQEPDLDALRHHCIVAYDDVFDADTARDRVLEYIYDELGNALSGGEH